MTCDLPWLVLCGCLGVNCQGFGGGVRNIYIYNFESKGRELFYTLSKMTAPNEVLHLCSVFVCVKLVVLIHVVVSVITYVTSVLFGGRCQKDMEAGKRVVLLITAHPDDECMFFSPFLLQSRATSQVHVLCLTNGNLERETLCVCARVSDFRCNWR